MAVDIIFETHSISTDNEAGIATGWWEGRLSARGRDLARDLGRRRRDDGLAALFVSDLRRAVETVEIAFGDSPTPVHLDARLRECDYGELNGAPVTQLAAERARRIDHPFPGGESFRDAARRMDQFLGDLAAHWDGQRVLIVGHSATRWSLDHLIGATPLEDLVDAPFQWRDGWRYVLNAPK